MDKNQAFIYFLLLAFLVLGISAFMEFYKKIIRKNKSTIIENRIIAAIVSTIPLFILNWINVFQPLLGTLGAPIWADHIFYFALIYLLQRQADMKIMKALTKACAKALLSSYGFNQSQIDEMINAFERQKKENPDT